MTVVDRETQHFGDFWIRMFATQCSIASHNTISDGALEHVVLLAGCPVCMASISSPSIAWPGDSCFDGWMMVFLIILNRGFAMMHADWLWLIISSCQIRHQKHYQPSSTIFNHLKHGELTADPSCPFNLILASFRVQPGNHELACQPAGVCKVISGDNRLIVVD